MEQAKDTQPRKRSGAPITILIAVVAFLVGIGLYALLSATVFKPTATTSSNGDKKDQTTEPTTLSYDTYKDFIRRNNIIVFRENTTNQVIIGGYPIYNWKDLVNPTAEQKASYAYMYSDIKLPDQNTWDKSTVEEGKAVHKALGHGDIDVEPDSYFVIRNFDISEIQAAHKKLFGSEIDTSVSAISFASSILDCVVYVPSLKTLFSGLCGGGLVMNESYTYINDVVFDGDKVYTYFNFIKSDYVLGDWSSANYDNLICSDNFENKKIGNCYHYFGTGITDYTYKELQNYRLVFEKDADGNYIYKTIEKV